MTIHSVTFEFCQATLRKLPRRQNLPTRRAIAETSLLESFSEHQLFFPLQSTAYSPLPIWNLSKEYTSIFQSKQANAA